VSSTAVAVIFRIEIFDIENLQIFLFSVLFKPVICEIEDQIFSRFGIEFIEGFSTGRLAF